MNTCRSTYHSALALSCALLALWLMSTAKAADVPLRAFIASYDLHRSGMHFATAQLSLARVDQYWRWRLSTRTRGFYAVLYNKKPYTQSVFALSHGNMRLHSIELSDEDDVDEGEYESARFDWTAGKMEVLRKGTQRQAKLTADVYDYQTIHLLAATLQLNGQPKATVKFYRKGKLVDSQLAFLGTHAIEFEGETIDARVYQQTVNRSGTVSRYYYDARNPLLPLRVETRKDDDEPTILRLREVEWRS